MEELLYREECYKIQGAIFEVYKTMGTAYLESVYQESLEYELENRKIPFQSQKELDLKYKNRNLKQKYIADLVCYGKIIVELKAIENVNKNHKSQLFNYLKSIGLRLGLLVNFGHYPKVEINRIII